MNNDGNTYDQGIDLVRRLVDGWAVSLALDADGERIRIESGDGGCPLEAILSDSRGFSVTLGLSCHLELPESDPLGELEALVVACLNGGLVEVVSYRHGSKEITKSRVSFPDGGRLVWSWGLPLGRRENHAIRYSAYSRT